MSVDRERDIVDTFVSLASDLANGVDVAEMLSGLTSACARLLDVASAGLLLADARGALHLMAASSDVIRELELFQIQRDEGPCLDCYRSQEPVIVADLKDAEARWPLFVAHARESGVVSVNALPLRRGAHVLGTLGLFGTRTGQLNDQDLRLARALADVSSVALVQDSAVADSNRVNAQLQAALNSRVVIEQAKGVVAQQANLDMSQAFDVLRRYARHRNERLTDVAQRIVSRDLSAQSLLALAAPSK